jgi:MarR family transcriptional regulator, organic hydroperoxide resistance regulator
VKSSPISRTIPGVTELSGHEPSTLACRLATAAFSIHAALERELHDTLVELDLTIPLSDVLWQLDPELGPPSRRELAERLHCDPSNVTFLFDRLAKRRLVTRARAVNDRRINVLALTPAGIEVRERLIATIAESSMFGRLTNAQQRAAQPAPALRRLPAVIAARLGACESTCAVRPGLNPADVLLARGFLWRVGNNASGRAQAARRLDLVVGRLRAPPDPRRKHG